MKYGADDLRRLSGLLDQALDLAEDERESWLEELGGDAASFRPVLRKMLQREAVSRETDGIFKGPPTFTEPAEPPRSTAFNPGDAVGPYRLLRVIGRGGMGEVWLAERADGQLKRGVALKLPVLSVSRSVLAQRFERERDILGALVHPNIARLYDAGFAEDGQPFMALEYVEGTPITKAASEKALDARERVRLLRQVMDAVQYAHANLVIHRDLKPDNVLVTAEGKAKLLDFGIAKLVEEETSTASETELTRLGGRALTLYYASPEQVRGDPVSTATDVWALGVLLYELLTGTRPFGGKGRSTVEGEVLESEPVRPSQRKAGAILGLSRSFAADLDTIAMKALKKAPRERYATVSSFADDLDRWLRGEPVRARPDSAWYRTRKFVGRHTVAVAVATLAVIALIGTASVAILFAFQAREESARAIAARDFMVEMFRRTDPDASPGKEVSAKQLLVQGYGVVATMEGQALLQSDLLAGIGSALSGMEEFQVSDNAYKLAALRYREAGRAREAASVILDRAEMRMAAQWQVREAPGLLDEAESAYPAGKQDDQFLARSVTDRLFAAYLDGNMEAVRTGIDRARSHVERALRDNSSRTVYTIRVLAGLEGQLGLYPPAIDRLGVLLARLREQKSASPSDMLGVQGDIAVMENLAGRYRASLERFDAASAFCQRSLSNQCIYATQYQRSRVLLTLGYHQRALEAVPFLLARTSGDQARRGWETLFAVNAYEILARNGDLARHPAVSARIQAMGESAQETPRTARLHALVAQTRTLLEEGRPQQAKDMSDKAQAVVAELGLGNDRSAIRAHLQHGLAFQALGQHDAAVAIMDRTYAAQAGFAGAEHPMTQLVSVHRARALWALNRPTDALQVLDRAIPILEKAMGADAPTFVRLTALRNELAATKPGAMPATRKVDLFM